MARCLDVKQLNRPTDSFKVLSLMLPAGTKLPLADWSDFANLLLSDQSEGLQVSLCAIKYHSLWSATKDGVPLVHTQLLTSAQDKAVRAMRELDSLFLQSDKVAHS